MSLDEQGSPSLLLRVQNSNQLESGCDASYLFGPEGGRVGSGEACLWHIQDGRQSVAAAHFDITLRDGAFCLHSLKSSLLINGAPVREQGGIIRLQQGDEITAGELTLKVFISLDGQKISDLSQITPESLVTQYSNPLESMLEKSRTEGRADDHSAQGVNVAHSGVLDPLRVLQNETLTRPDTSDVLHTLGTAENLADDRVHSSPLHAIPLSDRARNPSMDQDFIELPHINASRPVREDEDMSDHYVAITPLMRGINAPLSLYNSQQAHDFLEEAGRTLQSAIKGLLALQCQQDALSDKHLRPLEDNPLRLRLDYDTTLDLLFAEGKSPVHLSAPEAVAECLHNLHLHQQANHAAISEALEVILAAFSPAQLMVRFARYRRSAEREEMDAAWGWNMYCRYYEELTSSRQQGFSKLFNEVYEQAYDRALRQGERERQQ